MSNDSIPLSKKTGFGAHQNIKILPKIGIGSPTGKSAEVWFGQRPAHEEADQLMALAGHLGLLQGLQVPGSLTTQPPNYRQGRLGLMLTSDCAILDSESTVIQTMFGTFLSFRGQVD